LGEKIMKRVFFILFLVIQTVSAYGFGKDVQGSGNNCKSCHNATKADIANILKNIDPNLVVEDVTIAPVRGLYQVIVKKGGKDLILYLDFSKKHIVSGSIIDVKEKKDITIELIEERQSVDVSKISIENAILMGNPKGSKKLIVFSDPECPACKVFHEELTALTKEDKQVVVYIILFGLPMHRTAPEKVNTIVCQSKKNMSKAVKLLDDCYNKKEIVIEKCGKDYNEINKKVAGATDIPGTPTIIFPNGKIRTRVMSKDEIQKLLESK
jgi:thiol:disulfide interchange protein DsbC